jgi:hypothetical protein
MYSMRVFLPEADGGRTGCFTLDRWGDFLSKVCSHNEKPDHYAAAICIRVRSDGLLRTFCRRKLPPVHVAKRLADLRCYPDAMKFSSNGYFFFFLAVFLAVFFAFFAFLAMLPSVIPKIGSMQVGYRRA